MLPYGARTRCRSSVCNRSPTRPRRRRRLPGTFCWVQPTVIAYLTQAWGYHRAQQGDAQGAVQLFERAAGLPGGFQPSALHAWAQVVQQQGDVQRARALYRKALDVDSRHAASLQVIACSLCFTASPHLCSLHRPWAAWSPLPATSRPLGSASRQPLLLTVATGRPGWHGRSWKRARDADSRRSRCSSAATWRRPTMCHCSLHGHVWRCVCDGIMDGWGRCIYHPVTSRRPRWAAQSVLRSCLPVRWGSTRCTCRACRGWQHCRRWRATMKKLARCAG